VLVALACTVRINVLFVAAGVFIMFLMSRPGRRLSSGWRQRIPFLDPWPGEGASAEGSARWLVPARSAGRRSDLAGWIHVASRSRSRAVGRTRRDRPVRPVEFKLELLAAVVGVTLVGWLARGRRWAELVHVGLSVFALVTSTVCMSFPREMLPRWPLWIGLAVWLARRRWAKVANVAVSGSLMISVALLIFSGQRAG